MKTLQEALTASEAQSDEDDLIDLRSVANVARTVTVSVPNDRVVQCMNSLYIDDERKVSIMDNGVDTCVLGKGWKVIAKHPTRKAHVVGFDHKAAVKRDLDIVTAITAVELTGENKVILLQVNEAVHNPTSEHSLLS